MTLKRKTTSLDLITKAVVFGFAMTSSTMAQEKEAPVPPEQQCKVDTRNPGIMKDIVSNVLLQSVRRPEADVKAFLKDAEKNYTTGKELMRAAARHFKIDETKMAAEVEWMRHINCNHKPVSGDRRERDQVQEAPVELSSFALDVTLHVILHELGHALIREFDLPVLGNEETVADAFATHYLTNHLPDRAVDVLRARTISLMIEAREVPREQWTVHGEHNNDGRRAFQIAALAVAADPAKYDSVAESVGMSDDDIRKAKDYGAEIHRSWRRTLAPLMMPDTMRSNEARVVCDSGTLTGGSADGLLAELESAIGRFDWHSQITIRFAAGDGGASWSRDRRTITVNSQYLRRFVEQGRGAEFTADPASDKAATPAP